MKKKLLALLCVLSILVGLIALSVTAATSTEDTFRVGYAKVDINPYYEDGDPDSGIMPVPLRGNGSAHLRLAYDTKMDDNGDGKVDGQDGLFVTCIAVSDSQDNTVLLITMDAIGDMGHTKLAREEICKRIPGMTEDRIMVSGTHAHGGVDLTQINGSNLLRVGTDGGPEVLDADGNPILGTFANECLLTWRDRLIDHIADAAEAAMANRATATVKKGQIEASTAYGKVMNSVRHYICTDGRYSKQQYVRGDNFNPRPTQINGKYVDQVSEIDQTLHVISFEFTNGNQPIILANWRCHPSLNTDGDLPYTRTVSSDYVNAFRYQLERVGYRPAFFQGAGGNNNPTSKIGTEGNWITGDALSGLKGNTYGSALAQVTLQCLSKNMKAVETGQIKTLQQTYQAHCQTYTKLQIDAAYAAVAAYNAGTWNIETPNTYPYVYSDGTGTFCIASVAHANTIISHRNYTSNTTVTMEIDALLLGPEIAIVTTPGESFDRYSSVATLDTANKYNDWDNLEKVLNAQYGTPLIFGYTNQHIGYIPNALAYTYNENKSSTYAVGSYESQITPLAQGEGEIMVAKLTDMLNEMVNNGTKAYCQYCQKDALWYPLNDFGANVDHGHYYLSDDLSVTQKQLKNAKMLCLDLSGHTLTSATRAFMTAEKATLNIMDSSKNQTGRMVGTGAAMSGGAIWIDPDSTVNIYSGTITCNTATQKTAHGGVIYIKGALNIYGGQILGSDANNNGGAIYVNDAAAQLNVYGGRILSGTSAGFGECVAVNAGTVKVAGDSVVEEICYLTAPTADTFQIVATAEDPAFTGEVVLNKKNIAVDSNTVIGSCTAQWASDGVLTIPDGFEILLTKDHKLVAQAKVDGAAAVVDDAIVTSYETLDAAIANVGTGYVILGEDVTNLTVSQDITVDLNGKTVKNAEATNGVTLLLQDRKTNDYCVDDGVYGVVGHATGNVVAADNYLAITDTKGTSYHRYGLRLRSVTLRPSESGIYYKSEFLGDSMVAQKIETFGVALSILHVPDETNMEPGTYSSFAPDAFGGVNTSTVLVNIMDAADPAPSNAANALEKVYGRAYIKLNDGSYLFSDTEYYSLQELTEIISEEHWSELAEIQKNELLGMYQGFRSVMENWNIENIKEAYEERQA